LSYVFMNDWHRRRSLQDGGSNLNVDLEITGQVTPANATDADGSTFSFSSAVLNGFVNRYEEFTDDLYEASAFFAPVGHSTTENLAGAEEQDGQRSQETAGENPEGGGNNAMMIGIIAGSSIGGLALAVSCAAFFVRRRRLRDGHYGGDGSVSDSDVSSKDVFEIRGSQSLESGLAPSFGNGASLPSLPVSPNAMEKGGSWDAKGAMSPFNLSQFSYDKSLVDESVKSVSTGTGESVDNTQQVGLKLTPELLYQAARKAKELKRTHDAQQNEDDSFVPSFDGPQMFLSTSETNSGDGDGTEVGFQHANDILGDQFDTGVLGRGGSSLESNSKEDNDDDGQEDGTRVVQGRSRRESLAAVTSSPVAESSNISSLRSDSTDQLTQGEVYDCYAPPGPLGIVIDTTSEGPIIHSLKPTSQLLGLINTGDLVVGLDDIDTRGMTAATVTRLMAKRSQQPQRKITLLRGASM